MNNDFRPDYEKAEEIYRRALGKGIEGEENLIDRLNELKVERDSSA
jgi:hypothetical protein